MPITPAPAIILWRDRIDRELGGLTTAQQLYAVFTMLFGCNRYLESHPEAGEAGYIQRIEAIRSELERWLSVRGMA